MRYHKSQQQRQSAILCSDRALRTYLEGIEEYVASKNPSTCDRGIRVVQGRVMVRVHYAGENVKIYLARLGYDGTNCGNRDYEVVTLYIIGPQHRPIWPRRLFKTLSDFHSYSQSLCVIWLVIRIDSQKTPTFSFS